MSERLDLAEAALMEAMGERLEGLMQPVVRNAARQILEAADRAGPRADLTERCPVVSHGAGRCVLPVGHDGFHQEQYGAQWFVAGGRPGAPRVTREMVEGNARRINAAVDFFSCALCGVPLPMYSTACEAEPLEAHRAWHDRLERLLETRP